MKGWEPVDHTVGAGDDYIAPDGRRRYVTEGMLRALHRDGREQSETYHANWPLPSFRRVDAAPLTPQVPCRMSRSVTVGPETTTGPDFR